MSVVDAWPSIAFGKEGFLTRHLRARQLEKVAYRSVFLRSLNYAAGAKSMGSDLNLQGQSGNCSSLDISENAREHGNHFS